MATYNVHITSNACDRASRDRLIQRIGGRSDGRATFLIERAGSANAIVRVDSYDWHPDMTFGRHANVIYFADTGAGSTDGKRAWLGKVAGNGDSWEYWWRTGVPESCCLVVNGTIYGRIESHADYEYLWFKYLRTRFGITDAVQTLI